MNPDYTMGSIRGAKERMEAGMSVLSNASEESTEPPNTTWPLGGNGNAFSQQARNLAPQRPPRPSYVPSMVENNQQVPEQTSYTQSPQYSRNAVPQQAKYWEPNYAPLTPGTISSRDSAGSSVGSIPDFPTIPSSSQALPRRLPNMRPPPSTRKGPSSYYTKNSSVAPIPEERAESPQQTFNKRAQVMSDQWSDDVPDIRVDRSSTISGPGEHMVEPAGLVRNASIGKQYKPNLTTVRRPDEPLRQQKNYAAPQPTVVDRSHLAAEHTVFVESVDSDDEDDAETKHSMEGATFLRDASEDSDMRKDGFLAEKDILVSPESSRASTPTGRDPRMSRFMAGLEKGGAVSAGTAMPGQEGRPKPAPFDFATEASQRASLTSLTDLIRRATKVKTNLEKGRTASRLGLLDFFSASSKSDLLKMQKEQPRESLTDMLGSFPPPATGTPTRDQESPSRWPDPFVNTTHEPRYMAVSPRKRKNPKGRRCCGLPLWGFVLAVVLLVVLVAAAVLIPIFLIVLPNQQKANAACPNSYPCQNGGYSITTTAGCRCICTGGYTGPQCASQSLVASDCTSAQVDTYSQVTLGTKVLPVLNGASGYSIPLNSTIILSDFSYTKLSCGDESNLVTFLNVGNSAQKREAAPGPTPVAVVKPRAAQVSNIVVDSSTTSASAAPTATGSPPNSVQIGFAQTAILYILQQTSLDIARGMRTTLDQSFALGNWLGPVVSANNGITVDMRLSKVTINGTSVGQA